MQPEECSCCYSTFIIVDRLRSMLLLFVFLFRHTHHKLGARRYTLIQLRFAFSSVAHSFVSRLRYVTHSFIHMYTVSDMYYSSLCQVSKYSRSLTRVPTEFSLSGYGPWCHLITLNSSSHTIHRNPTPYLLDFHVLSLRPYIPIEIFVDPRHRLGRNPHPGGLHVLGHLLRT